RMPYEIYFKYKQNELKGPFTEREVQEWYRKGWFESTFPFYFMEGDEKPEETTKFLTLDELRTRHGVGCPFRLKGNEEGENKKEMEEGIDRMEKELKLLEKKCTEVGQLQKRMEEVEKKLQELSKPSTSATTAAAAASKPAAGATRSSAAAAAPVASAAKTRTHAAAASQAARGTDATHNSTDCMLRQWAAAAPSLGYTPFPPIPGAPPNFDVNAYQKNAAKVAEQYIKNMAKLNQAL
ncbi:hypothetical protein PFISCL1PPCAC_23364, partial [Pristionchus fissidentatus]